MHYTFTCTLNTTSNIFIRKIEHQLLQAKNVMFVVSIFVPIITRNQEGHFSCLII